MGIHMQPIWERIYDAIIKAIISVEHHLFSGIKKVQNPNYRNCCFELLGFDIILDNSFKPYILEVNFSPSLSADSPLDYHIKSNLLVDTLNIAGIKKFPRKKSKNPTGQPRKPGQIQAQVSYLQMIQQNQRSKDAKLQRSSSNSDLGNFTAFLAGGNIDQYFMDRLSRISAKHRELVFESLDEFQRNRNMNFTCIFPSPGCQLYDKFFEGSGRQSNQLLHRYLFTKNELYSLTKQIQDYQKQYVNKEKEESEEEKPVEKDESEEEVVEKREVKRPPRLVVEKPETREGE